MEFFPCIWRAIPIKRDDSGGFVANFDNIGTEHGASFTGTPVLQIVLSGKRLN